MAADECLAAEAERIGGLALRLYGWTEPTLSLGGFQPLAAVHRVGELAGVAVVRRPSGGGAIVHGTDLTYAAAVPKGHRWGGDPQAFYDALHTAMTGALRQHGIVAHRHDGGAGAGADPPFFCFDRRSAGDLVIARASTAVDGVGRGVDGAATAGASTRDAKIMGSAQRRLAGAVLQHGTLLLAANPAVAGPARHPGIVELCGRPVAAAALARDWVARIARALDATPDERGGFVTGHEPEIEARAGRFRDMAWTARR